MVSRLFALVLLPAVLLTAAAKKTVATAKGENEDFILTVTLHIDPADVKEVTGSDLDGHFIVADVKVDPKYGKEVAIDRDDFQLRTDRDGDKAKPFAASQIAGQGALVLSEGEGGEVKARKSRGWSMGGIGMGGGGGGGTAGEGSGGTTKATMKNEDQENPLKKILEAKSLPEKKTTQPISGLLYFPMEKQKMKDLELTYGGRENRISLRFK